MFMCQQHVVYTSVKRTERLFHFCLKSQSVVYSSVNEGNDFHYLAKKNDFHYCRQFKPYDGKFHGFKFLT